MEHLSIPQKPAWIPMVSATQFAASVATADPAEGRYYDHYGMMGWGGWIFGPIMMVIFFALLVGAIVVAARLLGGDTYRPGGTQNDKALSILRERYARGEMTQDEFESAKKVLE
jgi:putative membrane protein